MNLLESFILLSDQISLKVAYTVTIFMKKVLKSKAKLSTMNIFYKISKLGKYKKVNLIKVNKKYFKIYLLFFNENHQNGKKRKD